jgi:hypothetical protein
MMAARPHAPTQVLLELGPGCPPCPACCCPAALPYCPPGQKDQLRTDRLQGLLLLLLLLLPPP